MAFRRRRQRRGGIRLPNRWTCQLGDSLAVGTAALFSDIIVARSDYASSANIEPGSGVSLRGIRGYITIAPTVLTGFSIWMALFRQDEDVNTAITGPNDPSVFQNFIDERVLWWWSTRFAAAAAATPSAPLVLPVHVKSRATLTDENIWLTAVCTNAAVGNNCTLTYNLRSNLHGFTQ